MRVWYVCISVCILLVLFAWSKLEENPLFMIFVVGIFVLFVPLFLIRIYGVRKKENS